ncbi:hypothetical protein ACFQ6C_26280 [Streptomyces sp. NPDC056454]|uniref:hypothetical protein n=1 Tax=Streptomyces sp. NPDC056454 TaxID=3345823 RepID=UPI0036D0EC2A
MTAPPWGHKPPAVADHTTHWTDAPPALSDRCLYWLRRIDESSWRPNRHFWKEGYDHRATWLGVWIWEVEKVILPILANLEAGTGSSCSRALGHDLNACCGSCHGNWEDGEYMCDGYDLRGRDLHACCQAAIISAELRKLIPWYAVVRA